MESKSLAKLENPLYKERKDINTKTSHIASFGTNSQPISNQSDDGILLHEIDKKEDNIMPHDDGHTENN